MQLATLLARVCKHWAKVTPEQENVRANGSHTDPLSVEGPRLSSKTRVKGTAGLPHGRAVYSNHRWFLVAIHPLLSLAR